MFNRKKDDNCYLIRETHLFSSDIYICSRCSNKSKKPSKVCPKCGRKVAKIKYEASWVDEAEIMDIILGDD